MNEYPEIERISNLLDDILTAVAPGNTNTPVDTVCWKKLRRNRQGGIERICHYHNSDQENRHLCYGCPNRPKCNADIYEQLAQYEDSGLSPERLMQYQEMDQKLAAAGKTLGEVLRTLSLLPKKVISVTLIRSRGTDGFPGYEQWTDTLYLPAPDNAGAEMSLDTWAAQTLRNNICAYLATKSGWESIIDSCFDYNWGDSMMEPNENIGAINTATTNADIVGTATVFVNQDEILIPQEVPVQYQIRNIDKELVAQGECAVDFTSGTLSDMGKYEYREGDSGFVVLPNGEKLSLDREEELQRLENSV